MIQNMITIFAVFSLFFMSSLIVRHIARHDKKTSPDIKIFRPMLGLSAFIGSVAALIWGFIYLEWYMPIFLFFLSFFVFSLATKRSLLYMDLKFDSNPVIKGVHTMIDFICVLLSVSLWI